MIKITCEDRLLRAHALERVQRPSWLDGEMGTLALQVEGKMKELTPVSSGLTRASIETRHPQECRYEIGSWTRGRILRFLDRGTEPHIILPRNVRALRWVDRLTGDIVFATRVYHPGTVPLRIMRMCMYQPWFDFLGRVKKRMREG